MALPVFQLSDFVWYPARREFKLYVCILSIISEIEDNVLYKFWVFIRQWIKPDKYQCEECVYFHWVFWRDMFGIDFHTVVYQVSEICQRLIVKSSFYPKVFLFIQRFCCVFVLFYRSKQNDVFVVPYHQQQIQVYGNKMCFNMGWKFILLTVYFQTNVEGLKLCLFVDLFSEVCFHNWNISVWKIFNCSLH